MIKRFSILFLAFTLILTSCDVLQQVATTAIEKALTSDDIGNGLKEALTLGIGKGSDVLSQKGGYFNSAYKILLPAEARQITDKLKFIVSAIKQMTITDALNILMGDKNAATEYLKRTTFQQLYNEFNPVIVTSLDKYDARKYWGDAVNTYNKIPLVKKANPSLDEYVTNQALNGLFSMVEEKERSIRSNTGERVTDLLKRVFAKQDTKP
jgi:Protein of unknown function (DUF4197)